MKTLQSVSFSHYLRKRLNSFSRYGSRILFVGVNPHIVILSAVRHERNRKHLWNQESPQTCAPAQTHGRLRFRSCLTALEMTMRGLRNWSASPIIFLMQSPFRRALGLATLCSLAALAGCGGGSGAKSPANPTTPTTPTGGGNASGAQIIFVRETDKALSVLTQMTLEEKVGQMLLVEHSNLGDINDIDRYHLGALLSAGGSGPRNGDNTRQGWANLINGYQNRALQTRLKIPLIYGIDAIHGNNNVPGATIFPHNIGLGATRDPSLLRQIATATAQETRAIGANLSFAPCVTVPQDVRWGRTYEGYSQETSVVRDMGGALTEGLQGNDLTSQNSLLACAKHFIGDGGTTYGTSRQNGFGLDQGDTRISESGLRDIFLPPYREAVAAGVASVMPSYSSYNGVQCSASRFLLTDLLKNELGFQGIVLSDFDAIEKLGPDYKNNVATAVNAGMDLIMVSARYRETYDDLLALVRENKISQSRIDDAVMRILRVKSAAGLLKSNPNVAPVAGFAGSFGGASNRNLARRAVRQSLVLLKNDNGVLPLSKTARIAVSGSGANNTGRQCGGWTITFQGQDGNQIPGATSIFDAMRSAAPNVTASAPSSDVDVNVVVASEPPYAEGQGDARDISLNAADAATIARARQTGKPVVVVLVSGRPLVLGDSLGQTDGLLAAWLPGSEGAGVADVLFGDANPSGKLPVVWPKTNAQLPTNLSNVKPNPEFDYGFGLSY